MWRSDKLPLLKRCIWYEGLGCAPKARRGGPAPDTAAPPKCPECIKYCKQQNNSDVEWNLTQSSNYKSQMNSCWNQQISMELIGLDGTCIQDWRRRFCRKQQRTAIWNLAMNVAMNLCLDASNRVLYIHWRKSCPQTNLKSAPGAFFRAHPWRKPKAEICRSKLRCGRLYFRNPISSEIARKRRKSDWILRSGLTIEGAAWKNPTHPASMYDNTQLL